MMGEEMSFWDHLEALRWCLFRVVVAFVIVLVGCFVALPHIFDTVILGPAHADFFLYRALGFVYGPGEDVNIININVASQFMTHISVSMWMALLIIFPYLMYQIWVFVRPALYSKEVPGVRGAFLGGTGLFYLGCMVGYVVVFPIIFKFLTSYRVSSDIVNQISLNSYMSTLLSMVFVMGLVFELPSLSWVLGKLGVISRGTLRAWRRYAVVVLLILAAMITPTGDPFTLFVVFLPLYGLYELSIAVVPGRAEGID
ncbi:MAG: twin-arginine translocase subunit TatC [Bacteroidales bacterium]|nr:twin-arginine translocase subunit TatC [Bacteroidales bacterium]